LKHKLRQVFSGQRVSLFVEDIGLDGGVVLIEWIESKLGVELIQIDEEGLNIVIINTLGVVKQ